eukprot:1052001-Pyramimonas_sp.AAC.4
MQRYQASIFATTEESAMKVEDLEHKVMMLEMENSSMVDKMTLYDAAEVEEHNRELRAELKDLRQYKLRQHENGAEVQMKQRTAVITLR